jgi:hypothetical protein
MTGLYREQSIDDYIGGQNDYVYDQLRDEVSLCLERIEMILHDTARHDVADGLAAIAKVREILGLSKRSIAERIKRLEADLFCLRNPGKYWEPASRQWLPCKVDPVQIDKVERELIQLKRLALAEVA